VAAGGYSSSGLPVTGALLLLLLEEEDEPLGAGVPWLCDEDILAPLRG